MKKYCKVCKQETEQDIIRNAYYCFKHNDFLNEPEDYQEINDIDITNKRNFKYN